MMGFLVLNIIFTTCLLSITLFSQNLPPDMLFRKSLFKKKNISLTRCCHPTGSGSGSSQRRLHSDRHHLRPGRHCGIPHGVGSQTCSALSTHVRHQRHLRLVAIGSFTNTFQYNAIQYYTTVGHKVGLNNRKSIARLIVTLILISK